MNQACRVVKPARSAQADPMAVKAQDFVVLMSAEATAIKVVENYVVNAQVVLTQLFPAKLKTDNP